MLRNVAHTPEDIYLDFDLLISIEKKTALHFLTWRFLLTTKQFQHDIYSSCVCVEWKQWCRSSRRQLRTYRLYRRMSTWQPYMHILATNCHINDSLYLSLLKMTNGLCTSCSISSYISINKQHDSSQIIFSSYSSYPFVFLFTNLQIAVHLGCVDLSFLSWTTCSCGSWLRDLYLVGAACCF